MIIYLHSFPVDGLSIRWFSKKMISISSQVMSILLADGQVGEELDLGDHGKMG